MMNTTRLYTAVATVLLMLIVMSGCSWQKGSARSQQDDHSLDAAATELQPVALEEGERLRVVASTSIVADVVANVGGEAIELTSLMPLGADPHSFTVTPQDLRTLNDAHVIFINGLALEESLMPVLENLDRPVPILSVSDGIKTLELGQHKADDHSRGEIDPHAWFSVPNVMGWTDNIADALMKLDPNNADDFRSSANDYLGQLESLDAELSVQIESVPEEDRKIVTDHIALGYLARDHGFETVGSVLPSMSTLAAASAQEMATLQQAMVDERVKAVFVSTSVNPQTASQLASDLGIPVVEVYTGSLSEADGPASTYIDLMHFDVTQIVEALNRAD